MSPLLVGSVVFRSSHAPQNILWRLQTWFVLWSGFRKSHLGQCAMRKPLRFQHHVNQNYWSNVPCCPASCWYQTLLFTYLLGIAKPRVLLAAMSSSAPTLTAASPEICEVGGCSPKCSGAAASFQNLQTLLTQTISFVVLRWSQTNVLGPNQCNSSWCDAASCLTSQLFRSLQLKVAFPILPSPQNHCRRRHRPHKPCTSTGGAMKTLSELALRLVCAMNCHSNPSPKPGNAWGTVMQY